MPKVCAFCQGGPPFRDEHVIPEWISRLVNPDREIRDIHKVLIADPLTGERSLVRQDEGAVANLKTRDVCKKCNEGWMHDLEDEVSPFMRRLIMCHGGTQLDPVHQLGLGRWTAKTRITYLLATHETVSREELDRFYEDWHPAHYTCTLLAGTWSQGDLQIPHFDLFSPGGEDSPPQKVGTSTTFVLGCLLLQIVVLPEPVDRRDLSEWMQMHVIQLWPLGFPRVVEWPPPVLAPDDLDEFYANFSEGIVGLPPK